VSGGQPVTGRFDAATRAIMPAQGSLALHLLRHGEVERFSERRVRGHIDEPASAEGVAQHQALAAWWARHHGAPDLLLCSDLARCADLGARLADATGAPLRLDARLREQSMGAWEGRSWEDLTRADPAGVTAWWDGYANARAPGGESLADLARRVEPLGRELAAGGARRVVLVTHIGVIRVLLCRALGLPLDQALRFAPAAASHTALEVAAAGAVLAACGERPWLGVPAPDEAGRALGAAPRVALSGSAGTGKTTLGRRLAEVLGVPFLEEGMRRRLAAGLDLHRLATAGLERLLHELWDEQVALEDAARGGFVADRSAADHAAFWIHYGLLHERERTEAWLATTLARLRRYDRVLLFPWGVLPLADDGVRSTNRWAQFQFQATLEGLLLRHAPAGRLLRVPASDDLQARLDGVLALLRRGA
jgi:broad specificity phosphatase PhoE/nicotinamide riboside kinase